MRPFNIIFRVVAMNAFDDGGFPRYNVTVREEPTALSKKDSMTASVEDKLPDLERTYQTDADSFSKMRIGSIFDLVLSEPLTAVSGGQVLKAVR